MNEAQRDVNTKIFQNIFLSLNELIQKMRQLLNQTLTKEKLHQGLVRLLQIHRPVLLSPYLSMNYLK